MKGWLNNMISSAFLALYIAKITLALPELKLFRSFFDHICSHFSGWTCSSLFTYCFISKIIWYLNCSSLQRINIPETITTLTLDWCNKWAYFMRWVSPWWPKVPSVSVITYVVFFFLFHKIYLEFTTIFFLGMPNQPQPSIRHNYDVCHLHSLLCQTLSIQTPRCNSQCLFNSVRSWCFGSHWSHGSLLVFVDCVWTFPVLLCGHDYFHCFWCLLSWHR